MSLLKSYYSGLGKLFGDITGSNQAASAARDAADAQVASAQKANDLMKYQFDQFGQWMAPYRTGGEGAYNQLLSLNGLNPDGTRSSNPVDYSAITNQPGYKFGLDQGMQAIDRNLAAQGLTNSGAQEKELAQFATGYNNQAFGDFYNRLSNLASGGQNAAAMTGQAGANYATNAGNNLTDMGNARASAIIANGNVAANNFNNLMKIGGTAAGMMGGK